jgi:Plasmid pRiA4b ORF-3-like protein
MARTAAKSAAAKSTAFVHVKVTLQYIRPPIWRRLLLPDTTNLGNLSEIIQAAMGWHGGHLHAFEIGGEQFGDPSMTDFVRNERKTTIRSLLRDDVSRFGYTYDFGDSWEHDILIEKKGPPPDAPRSPACVAGKRNCPPEDCGGPPGYDALLEALAAPESPESRELLEWVDGDYDPEEFSLDAANPRVRAAGGGWGKDPAPSLRLPA